MASAYYAICPGTGGTDDKKTGSPTITISSGVATLSVAQTGNIGQGFRITYDTSKVCFISKVNSATSFDVVTATGGTPSDEASPVTVNSITADYASLSAAEAGASDANHLNTSDLVTATTILNLVCYAGASADSSQVIIDGYTTNADYYVNIYAANGGIQSISNNRHVGIWNTSYYAIVNSPSGSPSLGVSDEYCTITGLQVQYYGSGNSQYVISLTQTGTRRHIIDSCIVLLTSTATGTSYSGVFTGGSASNTCLIKNSIILGNGATSSGGVVSGSGSLTGLMYNCTIGGWANGVYGAPSTFSIVNCVIFNNSDDFNSGTPTVTYTASDDNDISGTGNVDLGDSAASWNLQFADYDATNPDVRLVGNSLLLMTGIGPASDANVPTTDIAGNPRAGTLTSIGAFHKPLTNVYYSLSPFGSGDQKAAATCGISSGTMTLSAAQTGNIGIGCAVTYDTSKVVYISEYTDSTHFKVVDKFGVAPPDIAAGTTVNSITHVWASLSLAEAGADDSGYLNTADLTSANVVLNLCCYYDHDDYTVDGTACTISGWTTNATRYVKAFTPAGGTQSINSQRSAGTWDANKYVLQRNGTPLTLDSNNPYIHIDGLQIRYSGSSQYVYTVNVYCNYLYLSNCIIRNLASGGNYANNCITLAVGTSEVQKYYYIWNCILYDAYTGIYVTQNYTTTYFYYNTVCDCTGNGIMNPNREGNIAIVKNCIAYNNSDNWYKTTNEEWTESTNNLSGPGSDSEIPTTNAQNGVTVTFIGANDYRLASNDEGAMSHGTSLASDPYLIVTTDICGTVRDASTPDIGAFEYVSGSTPSAISIIPRIIHHLNQMRAN